MDSPPDVNAAIAAHYTQGDLKPRIVDILAKNGRDQRTTTLDDLAPLDHFHLGGIQATLELAELAGIEQGWRVVDVGGGLGGPARVLASRLRCQVTVLELTAEYADIGMMLSEWLDLASRVHYRNEDALAMPFEDGRFDAAWTQHATMNIADKALLYGQLHRVLRRGGRLAMHEIVAGQGSVTYPAPWADSADQSFLVPAGDLRALIAEHGFRELAWQDVTERAREAYRAASPLSLAGMPALGIHMLVPAAALRNMGHNLDEGRVAVVRGAFERR
ncbi:MAG: class I SAM-dependent methyltransferase [Chloroflexi bacterium]|nr:class I SAM-dependent methyltransferase [Chloroflexota bacterium]